MEVVMILDQPLLKSTNPPYFTIRNKLHETPPNPHLLFNLPNYLLITNQKEKVCPKIKNFTSPSSPLTNQNQITQKG
jgi:hypothetical protein